MLGRLQSFLQKNKPHQNWLALFGVLTIAGLLFWLGPASAADEANWFVQGLASVSLVVSNIALGLTIFFLRFFIMIASYNNYIDVDVVRLGWIMIRDIANMFFVVALLVIAFGTILGLEEYEWKKNLVKLILAAILINFSNLIAQLFIDVAHVFSITFLNAISATAGGNLITMFNLQNITALATPGEPGGSINLNLLAAAIVGAFFAVMAAIAMGTYVYIMLFRVVALWVLIVMSPLAFVLGVLPQTKSYADKWWSEFSRYVIVAPVMVFFMWLAFATLGLGGIAKQIEETGVPTNAQITTGQESFGTEGGLFISWAKVSSWENMANFFIAFAFLMYGVKATQDTGVEGSGALGAAADYTKKVMTIASGYAAGRWLVGKGAEYGKAGAVGTAKALGGDFIERKMNDFKRQTTAAYQNWVTAGPRVEFVDEKVTKDTQLTEEERIKGYKIEKRTEKKKDANGNEVTEDTYHKVYKGYQKNIAKDKNGNILYKRDAAGQIMKDKAGNAIAEQISPVYESGIQKFLHQGYQRLIVSRKKLEKVENDTKLNEEMVDKSIEAQPEHWLSSSDNHRDFDRVKRGMIKSMEARSSAKTEEKSALGEEIILSSERFKTEVQKEGPDKGKLRGAFQTDRPSIAEQIAEHKIKAEETQARISQLTSTAKAKVLGGKGRQALEGKIKAELEVKAQDARAHKLEETAMASVALNEVAQTIKDNDARKRYEEKIKEAAKVGGTPEELAERQEKVLAEMTKEGFLSEEEQRKAQEGITLNRRLAQMFPEMSKKDALEAMVSRGMMDKKEKDKWVVKIDKDSGMIKVDLPKEQKNVLQRTIADEKEGHLQAEKLATVQKEEEAIFAEGKHGLHEAEEVAIQKERAAAAQAKIDKTDAEGKAKAAEHSAEFAAARAEKIEASKEGHLESEKVATSEKEAEAAFARAHGESEAKKIAVLKEKAAAAEAEIKKIDERGKAVVAEESPEFARARARKIAAEKEGHTESIKTQLAEKAAEEKYTTTGHGPAELKEESKLKAKIAVLEAKIKTAEAEAEKAFRDEDKGQNFNEANIEAQAAAAANDYVKNLKEKFMQSQYEAVKDLIQNAAENGTDPDAELDALAKSNPFVRALRESKKLAAATEVSGIRKIEAEAEAEGAYVEMEAGGFTTPASPLVNVAKRTGDAMNSWTAGALGKALIDNIAHVAHIKSKGDKLNLEQIATLFGTTNKVNGEANIDDAIGNAVIQLTQLENKEITNVKQREKVEALKKLFTQDLGIIKVTKDEETGKEVYSKAFSSAENAAKLQNYAILSGDVELIKQHEKIQELIKTDTSLGIDPETGKQKQLDYKTATVKALGEDGGKKFLGEMKKRDSFLKEGAGGFKNQALATKHLQLGGHQIFDEDLGFHRMATLDEAKGMMVAETRKRKDAKVEVQYHSLGDVDMAGGGVLSRVDYDYYRATVGQAKNEQEVRNMQDRTRDGLMGYKPSEVAIKDGATGVLGGTDEKIEKRFGGQKEFIEKIILPQLAGGPKAFALTAHRMFANVKKTDAENGKINLKIGDGDDAIVVGEGGTVKDLVEKIKTKFGSQLSKDAKELLKIALEQAESQLVPEEDSAPNPDDEAPPET